MVSRQRASPFVNFEVYKLRPVLSVLRVHMGKPRAEETRIVKRLLTLIGEAKVMVHISIDMSPVAV
jgi:hypothetical protein